MVAINTDSLFEFLARKLHDWVSSSATLVCHGDPGRVLLTVCVRSLFWPQAGYTTLASVVSRPSILQAPQSPSMLARSLSPRVYCPLLCESQVPSRPHPHQRPLRFLTVPVVCLVRRRPQQCMRFCLVLAQGVAAVSVIGYAVFTCISLATYVGLTFACDTLTCRQQK